MTEQINSATELMWARDEAKRVRRWIKELHVTPSPDDAELLRRVSRPRADVTYKQVCEVTVRVMDAYENLPHIKAKREAEDKAEEARRARHQAWKDRAVAEQWVYAPAEDFSTRHIDLYFHERFGETSAWIEELVLAVAERRAPRWPRPARALSVGGTGDEMRRRKEEREAWELCAKQEAAP